MSGEISSPQTAAVDSWEPQSQDSRNPPRGFRVRISLLHVFLVVACCAIWIARMNLAEEKLHLESRLPGLREAARELVVPRPEMLAAVGKLPLREEKLWEVYVPPQGSFELRLASESIEEHNIPEAYEAVPLSPGRHEIELRGVVRPEESDLQLIVDGRVAVDVGGKLRTHKWSYGSSTYETVEDNQARPPNMPITLIRKRFNPPPPDGNPANIQPLPPGPADGVLLWIQPL